MTGNEIREAFLRFMEAQGHAIIPSSSLVPENDPTTLFTGSGMQPLVPYLMGEQHPKGTRLADSQKCFRAEDIEEVGDNRHTTFFEMLGNWSLGDYFKKEQLRWFYTFLTEEVGLDPNRLYITVFAGDRAHNIPKDTESVEIWQQLLKEKGVTHGIAEMGSEADGYARGMKEGERIFYYDASKNWWSRAGVPKKMPGGEIGGPDSEVFYDFGTEHDTSYGAHCHPNCDCGRFLEIGNSVFMEYLKKDDGSFEKLPHQNVDFGGGLERITAAKNNDPDVFKIDLLRGLIEELEKITGKTYKEHQAAFRIIADHIRGAVFMIADGVLPSNTEQGYFVRRLLRRAIFQLRTLKEDAVLGQLATIVAHVYQESYPHIKEHIETIDTIITEEEVKFTASLAVGLRAFTKLADSGVISGHDAFVLFTTHGFPYELTEELAHQQNLTINRTEFDAAMKEHQAKSRIGAESKFKGGLQDNSEKVVAYHTATHLLLAALRNELGDHVHQAGSNITGERLRFDFTHDEKVPKEILEKVEHYVNDAIKKGAHVEVETMPKEQAHNDPKIEGSFWDRYPDEVKVYTIKDAEGTVYSRELCGGPHVENTQEMGTFKITKEEASSAGVRRIKAVLTD